jgi:hypothetical protein
MLWRFLPARARRAMTRAQRRLARVETRVGHLVPDGPPVGRALVSYVVDPFLAPRGRPISYAHTQDWESWRIGRTLADLGFEVDAIHWTNQAYVPPGPLDLLIDARSNLERLAPLAGPGCLRIFHAETAHWRTNDEAQLRRLTELEARRGIRLSRTRLVGENHAIETADCAVVLGNEWTLASYRPFGKPLYRVPISNAFEYPSPAGKDFARCRGTFLWFGGVGFVHKGLDRVLDALAGQSGLELLVAAPIDREPDFAAAYARELFATRNVRALGWLDVGGKRFREVAARSLAMAFPSCSEGGGGSVVTTMHAGLIPVVTREASVDIEASEGLLLPDADVETIRRACRELALAPDEKLRRLATGAWSRARAVHSRAAFAANYRTAIIAILERFRPALAARLRR